MIKPSILLLTFCFLFHGWIIGKTTPSYYFDGQGIQKEVLENYLDRSITVTNLLVPRKGKAQLKDDIRMIKKHWSQISGSCYSALGKRTSTEGYPVLEQCPDYYRRAACL